ncbi:synaptonemal complex protein 1 isoform X1 [Xiphophorus maculatus]|uniref:synaptonemal complex protein 1 isoform X1 n=1 Tax=Xiphophorus maculatus TaxID=8083 RepID=UPI0006D8F354|nr:synaptonemal complex protein 1 isoform X1 [Xiphophorus maculatus]
MDKDRGFRFKLLVPPRVSHSHINAVRPQGTVGNHLLNSEQQVASSLKQDNSSSGELYSNLFDEVEKIQSWKVKVENDTAEKERRLQDNKRTIETQRKAIQDLQFSNESLSIKLEEQISENEDLRSKNNTTRNLCNILKETFQRSSEKMHLFESEREETHHLFMENSGSIKKLLSAFESLRIRVEADQQEMQKVKKDLLQFEDLKEKYHQEYIMKDKENEMVQKKLENKENELQKALLNLNETQKYCKRLQDSTKQQFELLQSLKTEKESLLQNLKSAEQSCEEFKKKEENTAAALEKSKNEYKEIIQDKDLNIQELNRVKTEQAEKLEKIETTIKNLKNSQALEIQRVKDLEDKLMKKSSELERNKKLLGETMEEVTKKEYLIKALEKELGIELKSTESLKFKIDTLEARVNELISELSRKTEEIQMLTNEKEVALNENSHLKEIKVKELEGQLSLEIKKNKECTFQMEQLKEDILQHEVKYEALLSSFDKLQSENMAIQQEFEDGLSRVKESKENMKVSEENIVNLKRKAQKLEEENKCLRDEISTIKKRVSGTCQDTYTMQKNAEEIWEHLQEEIAVKEKQIKTVEANLQNLRKTFEKKFKVQEKFKNENKILKKQIAKETAKSTQLEKTIDKLQRESKDYKTMKEEDYQKMFKDLESKSVLTAELENEVQKLKLTTAEAVKNKEDAELKCQHKIADMVALMEKHKSQYDRMVEEKDMELHKNKKKETEAVARAESLELDLSKQKIENIQLKKQLKTKDTEKALLQKEVTDLKKETSTAKVMQLSQANNKQSVTLDSEKEIDLQTPVEGSIKRYIFDLSKIKKTPSNKSPAVLRKAVSASKTPRTPNGTTTKTKTVFKEDTETSGSNKNRIGGISKMKSYRIRTPPSNENAGQWGKNTFELDSKSDSSDQIDLFTCTYEPAPSDSVLQHKRNIFKKIQSPISLKSPGSNLKLAAIKRMRDAGWTAVTNCDKKKKKTSDKIFA